MPAGVRRDQRALLQELLAAGMNPIFMAAGPSMQKQERFSGTVCLLKHVDTVDLRASSFHGCSMAAGAPTNTLGNATVIMDNPVRASAVEHLCPRLVFLATGLIVGDESLPLAASDPSRTRAFPSASIRVGNSWVLYSPRSLSGRPIPAIERSAPSERPCCFHLGGASAGRTAKSQFQV